ncbi:MAG: AAA family ATPase [Deltaproteobacteria bacterium]|jgi:putative ATPase|nr:AAA family ATPase [Deltaproteobacteria bacterium]
MKIKLDKPLAQLLRPDNIDNFIGQKKLLSPGKALYSIINSRNPVSCIFWGPPGSGKTTLARIICQTSSYKISEFSAVKARLADIRKFIKTAKASLDNYALFLDEIHRFDKRQQDALLPSVESGDIVLIGATTEPPGLSINSALRSRLRIFEFEPLSISECIIGLKKGLAYLEKELSLKIEPEDDTLKQIARLAGGDLRNCFNLLEDILRLAKEEKGTVRLKKELFDELAQKFTDYDKNGNSHYDHASAFQKSLRGSDINGSLYWLGKMLVGGEDPLFIARRLIITASEDVGMADPQALLICEAALRSIRHIGMPEAEIPLAQATIHVATAPKSNSTVASLGQVKKIIKEGYSFKVPLHLKDSHFIGARASGRGKDYVYPHQAGSRRISYLPEKLENSSFYSPKSPLEKTRLESLQNFLQHWHADPQKQNFDENKQFLAEKKQILQWLEQNNSTNVTTVDIAQDLDLDRKTVFKVLKLLEQEKKISIQHKAEIKLLDDKGE